MPTDALETVSVAQKSPRVGVNLSLIARDMATLGTGTFLAAIFGTLQVFVIPRILSIEDFGYWRLFLLYAGYVGLLHMGFADGALLRWAGRPLEDFLPDLDLSLKFIFWQQVAILAPVGTIAALVLPSPVRFIAVSVLMFALVCNTSVLLQYSLQATRRFAPVAAATAAPTGIFLVLAFLWSLKAIPSFQILIVLYFAAWICGVVFLWTQVKPLRHRGEISLWSVGMQFVALGWPIVLANISYGLIQTADRLVVSSVLPISQFALYSFAASTMFVPITAIAAVSRVFFAHVAAIDKEDHARVYQRASNLLFLAWSLLLPYYFVLDWFTRHFLPKYAAGVPVAGVLLCSVVFLAEIQVLHSSFFNLYGLQRRFLQYSAVAVLLSLALVMLAAVHFRSLVAVALAEVLVVGLWWQFNERKLQAITERSGRDWWRTLCLLLWSGLSFWVATSLATNLVLRVGLFYLMVVPGLVVTHPQESQMVLRLARIAGQGRNG